MAVLIHMWEYKKGEFNSYYGCLSWTVQSEGGLAFIIRGRKLGRTLLLLLVDLFLLLRELFIQLLGALLLSTAATAKETTSRHDDGLSKAVQIIW